MSAQTRFVSLAALLTIGAFFTACDAVVEYTVDNQTNQPLITRAVFEEDCGVTGGLASDYLPEQVIEPNSQSEYAHIYGSGPDGISCIQVLDVNRRLLLGENYRGGGVYAVTNQLVSSGEPAPDSQTLPEHSDFGQWKEDLSERPSVTVVTLFGIGLVLTLWFALVFVVPLAVLVILLILARDFFRRRRARAG